MAATYLTPGVYVEEVPSGSATLTAGATAIAAFVGFTASAPTDDPADPEGRKPRLVTSWTQYEQLYGGFLPGAMLPHSVYGWFNNGGGSCYVVRIPHTAPSEEPATLALPAADRAIGLPVEIATKEPNAKIVVHVVAAEADEDADETAPPSFDLIVVERGAEVERHEGVTLAPGDRNVATVVNAESQKITLTQTTELTDELNAALFTLKEGAYPAIPAEPTPVVVPTKEFAGSETARTGINGLVIADDVTMVMVPDLNASPVTATAGAGAVNAGSPSAACADEGQHPTSRPSSRTAPCSAARTNRPGERGQAGICRSMPVACSPASRSRRTDASPTAEGDAAASIT